MKHLRKFEELDPSTYRELRDRTADYPWARNAAKTPELNKRADSMERINKLSQERFESEFYSKFPKGTTIEVFDSTNPNGTIKIEFNGIDWKANWTYYDLDFVHKNSAFYDGKRDVHVRFKGDTVKRGGDPYTLDPASKFNFKGEIGLTDQSKQLLKDMFMFGEKSTIKQPVEEPMEEPIEEKPKGFISKFGGMFK